MKFLSTPFGLAVLACALLAGWAMWTGGVLDGQVAREIRSTSVYVAPGVDVDETAAERIIGNRRLIVVLAEPGTDLGETCDDVKSAAEGNVVLLLSPGDEDFDRYGCTMIGDEDDNFGNRFVADSMIANGVDAFVTEPLQALKVVAVNYDTLVRAGVVPDGARTISPSLSKYLLAGAGVAGVLAAAAVAYLGARRAGRMTVQHREHRDSAEDERTALSARAAVLASEIIKLDGRPPVQVPADSFHRRYRGLAAAYTELMADIAKADEQERVDPDLVRRVEHLIVGCRELTDPAQKKTRRRGSRRG